MGKKITDADYPVDSTSEAVTEGGFAAATQSVPNTPTVESVHARVIYVGPNVPGGALRRFQVFKGGLPLYCEDLIKANPEIKELFVPVERLEATRKKIEELGTNEARLFYAVQKKWNRGVK
jgi:hypothetical protein